MMSDETPCGGTIVNRLLADLVINHKVDLADLAIMAQQWLMSEEWYPGPQHLCDDLSCPLIYTVE